MARIIAKESGGPLDQSNVCEVGGLSKLFRWRLLVLLLPAAALVVFVAWFAHRIEVQHLYDTLALDARKAVESGYDSVTGSLEHIGQDLLFLSGCDSFRELIGGRENRPVAPVVGDWKVFSRAKGVYDQIRWIDESGAERVRINYHADGPEVVARERLQNKGRRYYFRDTVALNPGELFVSPLDLNVENGQIEQPLKPMIRIGTPAVDSRGGRHGIVLLNYYGVHLLNRLRESAGAHTWMTNDEGYWLLGPSPDLEWGFMLERPENRVGHLYPGAWARISAAERGGFEDDDGLWQFDTLRPLQEGVKTSRGSAEFFSPSRSTLANRDYVWKLVHFLPRFEYLQRRQAINLRYLLLTLTGLALAFLGAWRLARAQQLESLALERAREATRVKSRFLANMSHEIRTPMNAITGFTYLLLRGTLEPKVRHQVKQIDTAARSLLHIINDILDFSKIEAGKLTIEKTGFHLDEVLDNVLNLANAAARAKDIELLAGRDKEVPIDLVGDPVRLGQILNNLVSNAIKFTERGKVSLYVRRVAQEEDRLELEFSVEDSGIGMDQDTRERLFQPFEQADASTTRKYGGTGLGLTITRQLVTLMGGNLSLESEAGKGSSFRIRLPFTESPRAIHYRAYDQYAFDKFRLLIVEDDARVCALTDQVVRGFGCRTVKVGSGEQAVEAAGQALQSGEPFDFILMDWRLPGIDGISAARTIKQAAAPRRQPVIILETAYGREQLLKQAGAADVDALLTKPVTASTLFDTLVQFVEPVETSPGGEPAATGNRPLQGMRLLLVEDNPINQEVAVAMLESAGAKVLLASQGAEAIEQLEHAFPDIDAVLMDLQMPVMDGMEATRRIRKRRQWRQLPIIAMTANATAQDRQACIDAGMNAHLPKPMEPETVFATLSRWNRCAPEQPPVAPDSAGRDTAGDQGGPGRTSNTIEGIDVWRVLKNIDNDSALMMRLVELLIKDASANALSAREAYHAGDRERAQRLVHGLKGTSGNLAADRVYRAAGALNEALKSDGGVAEALFDELDAAVSELAASEPAIRALLRGDAVVDRRERRPGDGGERAIGALVNALRDALEEREFAAREHLEELILALGSTGGKRLGAVRNATRAFDFEQAIAELERVSLRKEDLGDG